MDQSRLDERAPRRELDVRAAIRFEPPRLASIGGGRISRSAAEVGALADAREQGRAEAMAELTAAIDEHRRAAKEMAAAALALSDALDQLERADLGRIHDVEQQALHLALGLAEEVIGHEVSTNGNAVIAAAIRALALAPDRGTIVLRVHPSDATVVRAAIAGTRDTSHDRTLSPAHDPAHDPAQSSPDSIAGHLSSTVQVIADPSVERAGVVAEAGPLRIDAQVGSALARIRNAFAT